jgi:hypothetical protein
MSCTPIAKQRVGEHIPAVQAQVTIKGHSLLDNGPVNTMFSVGSVPKTEKTRRSRKRHRVENNSYEVK